jgi:hypothetical protein
MYHLVIQKFNGNKVEVSVETFTPEVIAPRVSAGNDRDHHHDQGSQPWIDVLF